MTARSPLDDPRGYTPTTEEVREEWMLATQEVDMDGHVIVSSDEAFAMFDRWLASVKASAIREYVEAARENPHTQYWPASEESLTTPSSGLTRSRRAEERERIALDLEGCHPCGNGCAGSGSRAARIARQGGSE